MSPSRQPKSGSDADGQPKPTSSGAASRPASQVSRHYPRHRKALTGQLRRTQCGLRGTAQVVRVGDVLPPDGRALHTESMSLRAKGVKAAVGVRALPSPARQAVEGALIVGLVGALAGLILGLIAYPPTAWFAVVEIGIPATALGLIGGLVVGLVTRARSARASRTS